MYACTQLYICLLYCSADSMSAQHPTKNPRGFLHHLCPAYQLHSWPVKTNTEYINGKGVICFAMEGIVCTNKSSEQTGKYIRMVLFSKITKQLVFMEITL